MVEEGEAAIVDEQVVEERELLLTSALELGIVLVVEVGVESKIKSKMPSMLRGLLSIT